jgi:hypothetical protein
MLYEPSGDREPFFESSSLMTKFYFVSVNEGKNPGKLSWPGFYN